MKIRLNTSHQVCSFANETNQEILLSVNQRDLLGYEISEIQAG